MPKIPEAEITRLKTEVSLVEHLRKGLTSFEQRGPDTLAAHCPFHEDKSPSFILTPSKNLWHCFGCGKGGTIIDYVMLKDSCSFSEAVIQLKKQYPSLAAKPRPGALTKDPIARASGHEALKRVIDYYHATLKQSPEAIEYLDSRGLNCPELIEHFKIGYSNRTLGHKLPDQNRSNGARIREELQSLGIIRSSGHEHFNGCITFPIIDENGLITEVYGRKVKDPRTAHLYLPGPHKGVFNPLGFKAEEIILCESVIDALSLWRHGFRNVTTAYGVEGFSKDLIEAFTKAAPKKVLIAFDADVAGDRGAEKVQKNLSSLSCCRVELPKGEDINSFMLKQNEPAKALAEILALALPMSTPRPAESQPPADFEISDQEIIFRRESRRYRVRGFDQNTSPAQLRINLAAFANDKVYIDAFDLYQSRQRQLFIQQAMRELSLTEELLKSDLTALLVNLEKHQDQRLREKLKPQKKEVKVLGPEREEALKFLRDPGLIPNLLDDLAALGIAGEETNKLVSYLACLSRKMDEPLAILIQSSSAAGKTSLMEAILSLIPDEDKISYSAMTGQSLFYMGDGDLKHKILAISEEEGVAQASYALKLLQSQGELSIASTGRDPKSGRLVTHEYKVEGPVMLFLTTTSSEIDEELMNRCLVLTVNESRSQTRMIHALQREAETIEGLLRNERKKDLLRLHQNAQRLLEPIRIVNPFAKKLAFADSKTRTRRDHKKYLLLIRTITFLHQHQRPRKSLTQGDRRIDYIEVTPNDIALANKLASEVLGRSLDELPPQTRNLLTLLCEMVQTVCLKLNLLRTDYRFTRKELRDYTGWSHDQIQTHLSRLTELEYVVVHRGGRGQSLVYELIFAADPSRSLSYLPGLIDVRPQGSDEVLGGNQPSSVGQEAESGGQMAPKCGPSAGHLWKPVNQAPQGFDPDFGSEVQKSTVQGSQNTKNLSVLVPDATEALV